MADHQAVGVPGDPGLLGPDGLDVLPLLAESFQVRLVEVVGAGARRAEVGVQALPAPGGLDDQDRLVQQLLRVDAEGELGTDLVRVCAETRGQSPLPRAPARETGDPDVVADPRRTVVVTHPPEQWQGLGVHAEVIERAHVRVPLHVGLPGQDEHLERLRVILRSGIRRDAVDQAGRQEEQHDRESNERSQRPALGVAHPSHLPFFGAPCRPPPRRAARGVDRPNPEVDEPHPEPPPSVPDAGRRFNTKRIPRSFSTATGTP